MGCASQHAPSSFVKKEVIKLYAPTAINEEDDAILLTLNGKPNKELQDILKQYPDNVIVSIEYCNIRELKYYEDRNLIVID